MHYYPAAVNPGVAIPFGAFRALLDQPIEADGPSAFDWIRAEYARLRVLDDAAGEIGKRACFWNACALDHHDRSR